MQEGNPSFEATQPKECNLKNFRILIVDDFQFMADLLAGMMREMGVGEVITFDSASGALNHLKYVTKNYSNTTHIDLALIDWLMPGMNGVDLIKEIRRFDQDYIKFLPIVLLSAYTSKKVVEAARDSGANEALVKPISAEKLAKRLVHIINNPRPYIKNDKFMGPDRRRKEEKFQGKDKRKTKAEFIKVHEEDV